jgi:hypothetical protein
MRVIEECRDRLWKSQQRCRYCRSLLEIDETDILLYRRKGTPPPKLPPPNLNERNMPNWVTKIDVVGLLKCPVCAEIQPITEEVPKNVMDRIKRLRWVGYRP